MFIKIGTKTAVVLVAAAAVTVWALVSPASFQTAANAVYDGVVAAPLDMIKGALGVAI